MREELAAEERGGIQKEEPRASSTGPIFLSAGPAEGSPRTNQDSAK